MLVGEKQANFIVGKYQHRWHDDFCCIDGSRCQAADRAIVLHQVLWIPVVPQCRATELPFVNPSAL
jgi:hypothetical protein